MSRDRADLIAALAGSVTPVRRAAPPSARAWAWLAVTMLAAVAAIHGLWSEAGVAARFVSEWNYVELAATAATGVTAIVAAFRMGVPGATPRWPWRPLVPLSVWMAASLAVLVASTAPAESARHSVACFRFVLVASAPMAVMILVALRRTRALRPWRAAAMAGLGVASLAAFLLAFCHPFALNPVDFVVHLTAVLVVVTIVTLVGGPILAIRHEN